MKRFREMTDEERMVYIEQRISTSDISSAGKLNAAQAAQFISLIADQTSLKDFVKTYTMTTPTLDLDNFLLDARQMRKPTEATEYTTPLLSATFAKRTLTPTEWIYPANVSYTFLEDNIARDNFDGFLMGELAKAVGNDLEDLNTNGDEKGAAGFIAQNDGWIALALANCHKYDTEGKAAPEGGYYFSDTIFPEMLAALPNKWKNDHTRLAFLMSPTDVETYEDEGISRQTGLGDRVLTTQYTPPWKGIAVRPVPTMPDGTHILTLNQNLVRGIRREFSLELVRQPRSRNVEITVTGRQDAEIEIIDALVIGSDQTD